MLRSFRARPSSVARPLLTALLLCGLVAGAQAAGPKAAKAPKDVPAELQPETLVTATIDPKYTARVYVADLAIAHISDGRIRVFDALGGKFLGMVSTAFAGNFALSAKADELYVATTHHSRSTRGERTDVLEVYDTQTLAFKHEVVLPPKRAQALNYRGLVRPTGNGRFVLVQNATPATSVTVVDLAGKAVASEVPTPGCWGVWPAASHPSRFSMLCGDGTVATVTLDDNGKPVDRQVSAKLFDADADAWFHHAEPLGDRAFFLSFHGKLTELDLGGPVAKVLGTRDIVTGADAKAGWRPGGYQPFAVDASGRYLVAAMHPKGAEGSHKNPAAKLWVVDLSNGKRAATLPGLMTISMAFSRDGKRLQAIDGEKGTLRTWAFDGGKVKLLATVPASGETVTQLESHD